jgi:hypothetical protein
LGAKLAVTIILSGLAAALVARAGWVSYEDRWREFALAVIGALGLLVLNFMAIAWLGGTAFDWQCPP